MSEQARPSPEETNTHAGHPVNSEPVQWSQRSYDPRPPSNGLSRERADQAALLVSDFRSAGSLPEFPL